MDVNHKRTDYLSWDEYFMGVAMMSGMRSKDPNSQVGACIVSEDNKILSMGYNGFPKGCSDDEFPWAREGDSLHTKYFYVTHSELMRSLITGEEVWKVQSFMFPFFHVMNVPRQLFRQVLRRLSMTAINMQTRRQCSLPKECWMQPGSVIINITGQDVRLQ